MLLQQETIASLMGLLESAKAEAAASLAPLTRPPSPAKRAALQSEAEARGRVRQDRCDEPAGGLGGAAGRGWRAGAAALHAVCPPCPAALPVRLGLPTCPVSIPAQLDTGPRCLQHRQCAA